MDHLSLGNIWNFKPKQNIVCASIQNVLCCAVPQMDSRGQPNVETSPRERHQRQRHFPFPHLTYHSQFLLPNRAKALEAKYEPTLVFKPLERLINPPPGLGNKPLTITQCNAEAFTCSLFFGRHHLTTSEFIHGATFQQKAPCRPALSGSTACPLAGRSPWRRSPPRTR